MGMQCTMRREGRSRAPATFPPTVGYATFLNLTRSTSDYGERPPSYGEWIVSAHRRLGIAKGATGAFVLALIAGASIIPVPEANAQGLFSFFGGFDSRPSYRSSAPAYAPSYDDRYSGPRWSSRGERQSVEYGGGGGSGTLCVRLCDGRHFPIPRASSGAPLNPAKVCNALCPAAKTQVFHGSSPEYASASNGTRYADLNTAFLYREKIVPDCSCTGKGPGGLAQIDVESDPTLRAGDIVATKTGLAIFKGGSQFPYKTADFTPVTDYGKINAEVRRKLSEIKVDQTARPVPPAQALASTAAVEEKPATRKPRRARVESYETSGAMRLDSFFR
jgi:hypothetical protein